jgi:amino acid adenylation domain-containing protein
LPTDLLHAELWARAAAAPSSVAVVCEQQQLSYAQLSSAVHRLTAQLLSLGLEAGDRVGLLLPKSTDAVVAVFAVLQAGGTYVPLCEQSPPARQLAILQDCAVRGLVTTGSELAALADLDPAFVASLGFVVARDPPRLDPRPALWAPGGQDAPPAGLPRLDAHAPAYILYTSGSTGAPKGVVVSHRGAKSFVRWATRTFGISATDRLANHAQLSFDLSILDLFAALNVGAQLHLLTPTLLLRPEHVCRLLRERGITLWYSVPSALTLLARAGGLAEQPPGSLRRVLFAGEVFPVPQLREVMQALPEARFFNLFGPTETNVCTWHSLAAVPPPDARAIPIGRPCDHVRISLRDQTGKAVQPGQEGELCVAGRAVMLGYFGQQQATRQAFWPAEPESEGQPLYRTGDRVRQDDDGLLWFMGRQDRQVKIRGYRVELGELEAVLAELPGVREAAAIAVADPQLGSRLHAALVAEPAAELSVLTVKLHCGRLLPRYMVPDSVEFRTALPRTSTGKIDLGSLRCLPT